MIKFSVILSSDDLADSVIQFLESNELVSWTVEKDFPGTTSTLCGYVENEKCGLSDFSLIRSEFPDLEDPSLKNLNISDWTNEYKKFLKPWNCDNLFWIPTHLKEETPLPDNAVPVYIEPGMAFGTGTHETTRLCGRGLMMFRDLYEKTGDLIIKNCIDLGCGSGILGISALKLGFVHATMIDIDPDAIRIAKINAQLNGLFSDQITFETGDCRISMLGRQSDVIVANILSDVLVDNADLLVSSVKPGGILCLSGILKTEKLEISKIFRKLANHRWGNTLDNSMDDGDWTALVYFRL